jgi:hypothetical protein
MRSGKKTGEKTRPAAGPRGLGEGSLEKRGVLGEGVDVRARLFPIAVAAEMVRSKRIDEDHDDVRPMARGRRVENLACLRDDDGPPKE